MSTLAASSASFFVSLIRSLCVPLGVSSGRSAPWCFWVSWGAVAGSALTEGAAPGPVLSLDEVGLSDAVAEVGLWSEVTPVLSVSCSDRMGPVEVVLPGASVVFGLEVKVEVLFVGVSDGPVFKVTSASVVIQDCAGDANIIVSSCTVAPVIHGGLI